MSKIIIIPGVTSTAAILALLEKRLTAKREAAITDAEFNRDFGDTVECFECGAQMKKFSTCPVCNPECRHE